MKKNERTRYKIEMNHALLYVVAMGSVVTVQAGDPNCNADLGVASGVIPDSSIKGFPEGTGPSKARLNRDAAWCFEEKDDITDSYWLTVDLGQQRLVSGLLTQGPPASIYPLNYTHVVKFKVECSATGEEWDACRDIEPMQMEDEAGEVDQVKTHGFGKLVNVQFVRLNISSKTRWWKSAEYKLCFRIEIIGCPKDVSAASKLAVVPHRSGYLTVTWSYPVVYVTNATSEASHPFRLSGSCFTLESSWQCGGEGEEGILMTPEDKEKELVILSAVWGATYSFRLRCVYQGIPVDCGAATLEARVDDDADCGDASREDCDLYVPVLFTEPTDIMSYVLSSRDLLLKWKMTGENWRTMFTLEILDEVGTAIVKQDLKVNQTEARIQGLTTRTKLLPVNYSIKFSPKLSATSPNATKSFSMGLLNLNADGKTVIGSVITSVNLKARVIWNGTILVTWTAAVARYRNGEESNDHVMSSDAYELVCEEWIGSKRASSTVEVEGTSHIFPSAGLNTLYKISLKCVFGGNKYDCGSTETKAGKRAAHMENNGVVAIYEIVDFHRTWQGAEEDCASRHGHLVSYRSEIEEHHLMSALQSTLQEIWIGANLCKNVHLKGNGSWSDGSRNSYQKFAKNVRLTKFRCCLKATKSQEEGYYWTGEVCQKQLPFVCEFRISELMSQPDISDVVIVNKSTTNAVIRWKHPKALWEPDRYTLRCCEHRKFLEEDAPVDPASCSVREVSGDGLLEAVLEDLKSIHEYKVVVVAELLQFNKTGKVESVYFRTEPERDILVSISPEGKLQVRWLKRITDYKENGTMHVEIHASDEEKTPLYSSDVNTAGKAVAGVEYGKQYTVVLNSEGAKQQVDVFSYPSCPRYQTQYKDSCYWITQSPAKLEEGTKDVCRREGGELMRIDSQDELSFVYNLTSNQKDKVHVSVNESFHEPKARDGNSCFLILGSSHSLVEISCDSSENYSYLCEAKTKFVPPQVTTEVLNVTDEAMVLSWTTNSAWRMLYRVQYEGPPTNLREKREATSFEVEEPPVTIEDLEPQTEYKVQVFASLANNEYPSAALAVITEPNRTMLWQRLVPYSKKTFYTVRSISYGILILCTSVAFLLFLIAGEVSTLSDIVAQVCFQSTLILAYVFLFMSLPDGPLSYSNEDRCKVTAVALHFLFLCCFVFLALESLFIASHLVSFIKCALLEKYFYFFAFGYGIPFLWVVFTAPFVVDEYVNATMANCWLRLDSTAYYLSIVPNGLFFGAAILLLFLSVVAETKSPRLTPVGPGRRVMYPQGASKGEQAKINYAKLRRIFASDVGCMYNSDICPGGAKCRGFIHISIMRTTRWTVLAILLLTAVVWLSGVGATDTKSGSCELLFVSSTILLGAVILSVRLGLDRAVGRTIRLTFTDSYQRVQARYQRAASSYKGKRAAVLPGPSDYTSESDLVPQYIPERGDLPNIPDKTKQGLFMKRTFNLQ